jgi:hypothetical protein
MYFKVSMRTNPATGVYSGYYRLVESYRNHCDRVCHRTMLNAGYLDGLTTDQLNLIQKILTSKVANHDNALFELPYTDDTTVIRYVDEFYNRMVAEKRIDVFVEKKEKKASKSGKDLQMIDLNSIRNKDVREIGAEWLSYQAMCQLQIAPFLESLGWSEDQARLALTHIISRAVYPASEFETIRQLADGSGKTRRCARSPGTMSVRLPKTACIPSRKSCMPKKRHWSSICQRAPTSCLIFRIK